VGNTPYPAIPLSDADRRKPAMDVGDNGENDL
jgi:hypothetical protein